MNSRPYQSPLVKGWNLLAKVVPNQILSPRLSVDGVMAEAIRTAGCSDFGEGSFLEPLERLLQSIEATADLHPFGRFYVKKVLAGQLVHRLKLRAIQQKHPEILQQRIKSPLIILGLPRTGSSFLFNLLAQDPAHRYLTNWEVVVSPVPPPGDYTFQNDPRRKSGHRLMHLQNHLAPALKQMHTFCLDGPEECTPLLMQNFSTSVFSNLFNIPAYSKWVTSAPLAETYQHHKRILQTLQWKYSKQRWLLKSPQHMAALEELLEVYPDACLIQTHRDPVKAVSSYASLSATFRGIAARRVDYEQLGRQTIEMLSHSHKRFLEQRRRIVPDRIMDIAYNELVHNPAGTLRRIYQHFEIPWPADSQERVQSYLGRDKRPSRRHRYEPEDFGLTPPDIRESFASVPEKRTIAPSKP